MSRTRILLRRISRYLLDLSDPEAHGLAARLNEILEITDMVNVSISELGKLGGKAGKGEAKVRGDSAYYKALRAKRKPKTSA